MSESHPQVAENTEKTRWDLLELDIPAPELPKWLATLLTAIAAILPRVVGADAAFEALRALCAPLPANPEWLVLAAPLQNQVRAAKDAKLAEITAVRAPVPHTERQTVPVVRETAPSAPIQVTSETPRVSRVPIVGQWRKHQGDWCVLLPLAPNTREPRAGDVVITERHRDGRRENKRVLSVWSNWSPRVGAASEGHLVAVAPTDAAPTYFVGTAPSAPSAEYTAPEQSAPAVNSELATFDNALAQDLAQAAGESQHNANTQASGSLADGTMRGVGFSTAQGYVTALANGVKLATAESYKATLRSSHGYTAEQINALTVTIIPEAAALPVGAGITHTPAGPSIFDMPKAQRAFRVGQPTTPTARTTIRETQAEARATLRDRSLIAGLMSERALLQWSWVGGGERKREAFVQAFEQNGIDADFVPPAPSAVRSCGHAVETLKGRDYDTKRLPSTNLPEGVKARYQVGVPMSGAAVTAGAAYGTILLVVDLHDDGSLAFDGDAGLAATVRSRYNAITGGEILKSDVLTAWLGGLLQKHFYAVKDGAAWYVPAGMRDEASALCDVISSVGWGSHRAIEVSRERDVVGVLSAGLRAALTRVGGLVTEAISECQERARVKANKDNLNPELAARRAQLTTTTASTLIKELAVIASRIGGYEGAMGEESARPLRQELITIQRALESVAGDETTARAAMLELS